MTAAPVNAGTYTLSESGPAGLCGVGVVVRRRDADRRVDHVWRSVSGDLHDHQRRHRPRTLTLVKTVTNDNGGTAVPTDWTLTRHRPTPIIGTTGSAAVTAAPVNAGTYTLTETGPAGYTACAWTCVGGTQTGSSIALALGAVGDLHDQQRRHRRPLTLVKTVINDNGGTAVGDRLDVDGRPGPTPISGTTGERDGDRRARQRRHVHADGDRPGRLHRVAWTCTGRDADGCTSRWRSASRRRARSRTTTSRRV